MAESPRPADREHELRAAIEHASMPPRDYRILGALFYPAQWKTAVIPARFQPRSLDELAARCHISPANVKTGLDHLERHGWLLRTRHAAGNGVGGRGHGTAYQLAAGQDCDCKPARIKPVPAKKPARIKPKNRPESYDVSAGQQPVPAEEGRDEGEVGEEGSPDPLTVTIAGRVHQALVCRGCGELCPAKFSYSGYHATCDPADSLPAAAGHSVETMRARARESWTS